ncbi:Cyclin [Quillaja saponaria]|uniref:Cyclin n=1 Tax=Quillaja saponaria TaxID=32244 RepID=A0AAD7QH11_QUISA|nr:Cyclin [Quillaja saponaria]
MLAAGEYKNHSRPLQPEPGQTETTLPRVLCILSSVLEKLVARNDKLVDSLSQKEDGQSCSSAQLGKRLNTFHGIRAPNISIPKYLERIYKLLVSSVMVASKMLDDVPYNNAFYARVGGVSNAELNKLELELLFLLDFGVMVSSQVFESYCSHLEKEMLFNGTGLKIERPIISNIVDDHVTEISVEDTQSFSPPQIAD